MKIGGFVKNSFVDFPERIACSIFTVGCNMRCWYCHNSHLFEKNHNLISEKEVWEFLNSHKNFLDGVVISGGEPTLQPDLIDFIKKVKTLGYEVKLDTNGTNYEVLKTLIEAKLVDYVAMDIKAPLEDYEKVIKVKANLDNINASIDLIMSCGIDYEFRTTFSPDLTLEDLEKICKRIQGAKCYSIQKYNFVEYNKVNMMPRKLTDFDIAKEIASKYVDKVNIKGL